MKSILICLFTAFGCSAFAMDAELVVGTGALRVKRDDGFYVRFYPGKYRTHFENKGRRLYFTIDRNGIDTGVTVEVPRGQEFGDNGAIDIRSTQTGQAFDITGVSTTQIAESSTTREHESCVYYRREWVCEHTPRGRFCHWEDVPYRGWRSVEYYYRTREQEISMTLNSPGNGSGDFQGREVNRQKVYTYEGACY